MLALPCKYIIDSIGACAEKGIRFVLLTSGDKDYTADRLWREQVLEAAQKHGIRLIGPDSIGLMRPEIGLNVSYWPTLPRTGRVGLICQSGSVTASVLDYAERHHIGFSSVITSGHESDITLAEMVDFLAADPATGVIALHIETLRSPRSLYSAIRAAGRAKPVVILKAASSNASRLISARTATAAGDDSVFDALIKRAGAVRCGMLEEFLATLEAFAAEKLPRLPARIAVIANGLGFASLAADAADQCGLELAQPKALTQETLAELVGSSLALTNPVDLGVTASTEQFCAALKALLEDPRTDGVLLSMSAANGVDPREAARAIAEASRKSYKPVIANWSGRDVAFEPSPEEPHAPPLPCVPSARLAALAFSHLREFVKNRDQRMRAPQEGSDILPIDLAAARIIAATAQQQKQHRLLENQAEGLLQAFGIPTETSHLAESAQQASEIAAAIGYPVAMKLAASGVAQRTDVGGVLLNILSDEEAREAFYRLRENCARNAPMAEFRGVIVQAMIRRPNVRELSLSMLTDPLYGPIIRLGAGGQTGSILTETAAAVPPVIEPVAEHLIEHSRIAPALGAFRGMPPADTASLVRTIMALSRMAEMIPSIAEIVINPLFIDETGVLAVDCSVAICARSPVPDDRHLHMAIAPCPLELGRSFRAKCGMVRVRAVRSDDFAALRRLLGRISRRSAYRRFHKEAGKITDEELIDFTQIDYDRETAVCIEDDSEKPEIRAVARFRTLQGTTEAEFGILVEDAYQGNGFGTFLMRILQAQAIERRLTALTGYILADNKPMRGLMSKLGYQDSPCTSDSSMLLYRLNLSES